MQRTFTYDPNSLASMMRCCTDYLDWRHGQPDSAAPMSKHEVYQTVVALRHQITTAYSNQRKQPHVSVQTIAEVVTVRVLDGKMAQVRQYSTAKLLKLARKVDHANNQD